MTTRTGRSPAQNRHAFNMRLVASADTPMGALKAAFDYLRSELKHSPPGVRDRVATEAKDQVLAFAVQVNEGKATS